jgi:hypothetical protein
MELRASDADREATVERLRVAAMEGRITSEELEARIQSAYGSQFCSELTRLTDDVTPPPAPAAAATVARPEFIQRDTRSVNGFAIASLVCSVAWFLWLGSVLGVVFGHLALRQIKHAGGRQGGKGLAIGGLVLGYVALTLLTIAAIADILG